ncbi:MAG: translation elongation factor Ts [Flavobacteriales bacterium]|nr:translation elongation factor Ts [Flavobacteriales bacterium]
MMTITAADVNKLRQITGAGMMDCKNALTEAAGDFDTAIDLLRKKGQKVAANRSDRDATEGLVIAKATGDGKRGVLIVLNCETDFVAKNADFGNVANTILDIAIEANPGSLDALKELGYKGSDLKIADRITEEIGKIGEKIDLSYYGVVNAEQVYCYNHPGNKLASIVGFNKGTAEDIAKDVAMQVAAMAPVSVDESSVPEDVKQKEIEIGREQAINEGKPAEMAEKIALGRLNKFYKESTLLNQEFIKDSKISVSAYLKQSDKDLTVVDFKRFGLN